MKRKVFIYSLIGLVFLFLPISIFSACPAGFKETMLFNEDLGASAKCSSITIKDPTQTTITLAVDDTQLDPFKNPNPYYIMQYSIDNSTWNILQYNIATSEWEMATTPVIAAGELLNAADIKVDITTFCETTYLRMLAAGSAATLHAAVAPGSTAGSYSISDSFVLTKECVAPTVTLKAYKGTAELDLSTTPAVCRNSTVRIEAGLSDGFYGTVTDWKWEHKKACSICGDTWHTLSETSSVLTTKVTEATIYRATPTVKICPSATTSCIPVTVPEVTINSIGAIVNDLTFDDNSKSKSVYCGDGTVITLKAIAAGPYNEAANSWMYRNASTANLWRVIPATSFTKVSFGAWTYSETPTITTEYKMRSNSIADSTGQVCTLNQETALVKVEVLIPSIQNTLTFDDGTTTKIINCGDNPQIELTGTYSNQVDNSLNVIEKLEEGETTWIQVDAPATTPFLFSEKPQKSAVYRFTSYPLCADVLPVVSEVSVVVNFLPVKNTLSSDKIHICGDGKDPITLTATATGPVAVNKWEYSEDSGLTWQSILPTTVGLTTTTTPVVNTQYRIVSVSACDNSASESTIAVQANLPFTAYLEIQPMVDKSKIFLDWDDATHTYTLPVKGGDVPMVAQTDIGGTAYAYHWSENIIALGNSYTAKNVTESATYSVAITDADGKCTSISNNLNILIDEVVLTSVLDFRSGQNNTFGRYDYKVENPLLQQALSENLGNYKLTIFNRYGQKITTAGTEGWDGKVNGKQADAGVYYYVLEYTAGNSLKQKKGSVEIIK